MFTFTEHIALWDTVSLTAHSIKITIDNLRISFYYRFLFLYIYLFLMHFFLLFYCCFYTEHNAVHFQKPYRLQE